MENEAINTSIIILCMNDEKGVLWGCLLTTCPIVIKILLSLSLLVLSLSLTSGIILHHII